MGRWWNGAWGRMARRDIWLYRDGGRWLVRAREGIAEDGRELTWPPFSNEWSARAWVDRLVAEIAGQPRPVEGPHQAGPQTRER